MIGVTNRDSECIRGIDGPLVRDAQENADHLRNLRFFGMSERRDAHFDICGRVFEQRHTEASAGADGDAAGVTEFYGGIGVFLVEYAFECDLIGLHLREIFRQESVDMEQAAGERFIAQNEAIDHLRRSRATINSVPISEDKEALDVQAATTPEEELIIDQVVRDLIDGIHNLPENYRAVAELRFIKDYAYEDIARTLGLPLGTVKTRISRARRMLEKLVENPADGNAD